MRFFFKAKDGGPESTVTGYWLIESKSLFSVALMKFEVDSREAYHSHAFNCVNWLIKGRLLESICKGENKTYLPSFKPFWIYREVCHKVCSEGTSWVLSLRGPWSKTWYEYLPLENNRKVILSSGRKELVPS